MAKGATEVIFDCAKLTEISGEAIRYLLLRKQHNRAVVFEIMNAGSQVRASLIDSELAEEITLAGEAVADDSRLTTAIEV